MTVLTALWGSITGFFWKYVALITIAGFVAIAAIAGVLWLQKASAEKKVMALTIERDRLIGNVKVLEQGIADRNDGIAELEAAMARLNTDNAEMNSLLEELRRAPDTDNAPIAPALRRLLDRLGGVRRAPAPH